MTATIEVVPGDVTTQVQKRIVGGTYAFAFSATNLDKKDFFGLCVCVSVCSNASLS
jgi:hypothetical protein